MAQPNEVKYGHTQRPAPTADDRGRSGSGDLRNGQVGQGNPALLGENDYNSSEVKYGKPEPRNQPGSADTPRDFQRRGDIRAELPAETAAQSEPVVQYRAGSGDPDYLDNGKVSNGQKDKTTSMGDAQQHSDNRACSDGITRESGDDSRLVQGGDNVAGESGEVKVNSHAESKSDYSPKAEVTSHSKAKILDFKKDNRKVTSHSGGSRWKKSRVKPGFVIRRIKGYDIVESEYGVSYLFVVTRKPSKVTSGDCSLYEHAGFNTWKTMEMTGRLKKGELNGRTERIASDRARAS